MNLSVISLLESRYREDLEQLFFFNPRQGLRRDDIVRSVQQYGNPRLVERSGGLRIELPLAPEAQTLYAMAETSSGKELAGVIVYWRNNSGEFEILHLAAKDAYTSADRNMSAAWVLVAQLCRIARQIKGNPSVRLPYGRGRVLADARVGG